MRIFGKSWSCGNCAASEQSQEAAPSPQHYSSSKEPAAHAPRPRLQEAAMNAARTEEAIFEVVAPSDVADPGCAARGAINIQVQESSAYVKVLCVLGAVALVLLSSLGALLSMADREHTLEVILSAWVWLVFAWLYAAVICFSELRPRCPNCTESHPVGIFQAAPLLASQVGRSCFHFAVAFQCPEPSSLLFLFIGRE
ncbi:unnamed protein product [Effrenium voratum]|uniref:Uncharacterized protein n=1 Tax=Effrenium voratum TaxID=2562239 RepID=A0AA36NBG1_9DINO|nr:unnamed protein product [Effrenium voratum]CAJ1396233.1 unnamed protein product [Effrenium voratum]